MSETFERAYLEWCRFRLMTHYWPRVQRCVQELSQDEIWWREHETNNSVGNLLLHLTGNLNQFVLSAFGGATDVREKEMEFSERIQHPKDELLRKLGAVLQEADRVLGNFDPARFSETTMLQGRERSYLEILSIVVEHFALHTGQIIYVAKLKTGRDFRF